MALAIIFGYFLEHGPDTMAIIFYCTLYYIYAIIGLTLIAAYLVFGNHLVALAARQLELYEANKSCDDLVQEKTILLKQSIIRMRIQNVGGIATIAICTTCIFICAIGPELMSENAILNKIFCIIYNIIHPAFFLTITLVTAKFESVATIENIRTSQKQTTTNRHSAHTINEDIYYKEFIISMPSEPIAFEMDPADLFTTYEQRHTMASSSHPTSDVPSLNHHAHITFESPRA
ncbi:hypothetical protein BDF19DRAFT_422147 [Syncephalis fuscata]|nr:hypothetical protein BDF19DRAFT_422147 [Syncephalis fuscata]